MRNADVTCGHYILRADSCTPMNHGFVNSWFSWSIMQQVENEALLWQTQKQAAQTGFSGSLFSATGQDAGAFADAVLIATHAEVLPNQFADCGTKLPLPEPTVTKCRYGANCNLHLSLTLLRPNTRYAFSNNRSEPRLFILLEASNDLHRAYASSVLKRVTIVYIPSESPHPIRRHLTSADGIFNKITQWLMNHAYTSKPLHWFHRQGSCVISIRRVLILTGSFWDL